MKQYLALILMICLCSFCIAETNQQTPADVNSFIENADICTRLAGEWDNSLSKQRKKDIKEGVDKYCVLAKDRQNINGKI